MDFKNAVVGNGVEIVLVPHVGEVVVFGFFFVVVGDGLSTAHHVEHEDPLLG